MKLKPTTALLLSAALASPAAALTIATDDFESYATGALAGNNGGTGWGGAWATNNAFATPSVVNGGLSYTNGDVVVDGGSQAVSVTYNPAEGGSVTDGLLSRALASSQAGTVYMSLLFQDTANPDFNNDFVQFGFDTGTANPKASVLRRNGDLQVRSNTGSTVGSGTAASVGTTNLLVLKATKTGGSSTYDEISLFLNPSTNVEPVTASAQSTANSTLASLDNFVARSAFHELNDAFKIDALTIGTQFADVVPSTSAGALFAYDGFEAGGATPGASQYTTGTGYGAPGDALVAGVNTYTQQGPDTIGFGASAPWQNGSFINGKTGGEFASSVYYQSIGTGLNYSDGTNDLVTAEGAVRHLHESTPAQKGIQREILNAPTPGEEAYYSFLIRLESENDNWNSSLEFAVQQGTGQPNRRYTSVGVNAAGQLVAEEFRADSPGSASSATGSTLALDQDYFVVVRLAENGASTDTMHVWLNPSLDTAPTLGSADIILDDALLYVSDNDDFKFDRISLTSRLENIGGPEDFFYFDEFRLGNTYADVTPFVPEPSSLALLGLLAVSLSNRSGLLISQRRKRR